MAEHVSNATRKRKPFALAAEESALFSCFLEHYFLFRSACLVDWQLLLGGSGTMNKIRLCFYVEVGEGGAASEKKSPILPPPQFSLCVSCQGIQQQVPDIE